MARLQMKTRTDPQPRALNDAQCRHLSRVYFSAHPEDYEEYRDAIAREIYRTHDCAFCFDTQPNLPYDEETLADLEHMNLFVIPITPRLLTDSAGLRVLEQDLAIANEYNIPVLPLMQKKGLERSYNRVPQLKHRQFLDKHAEDVTALAYHTKLENFLDSVLLRWEQIQEIQDAFAAKIFLSYRKVNRKMAQDLMRMIHQAPILRDVSIWYDEFLTPGEDFNENIREVLQESNLFTLVVTDNLLEAGNYVLLHEYPAALKLRKTVLPVQMETIKHEKFRQAFLEADKAEDAIKRAIKEQVRDMVGGTDAAAVCSQVQKNLNQVLQSPLAENNDPQQLFLMGLAYLHGIGVEENNPRGRALIESAARKNFPDALLWMTHLYDIGLGVKKDRHEAIRWNQKFVDFWKGAWEAEKKPAFLRELVNGERGLTERLYHIEGNAYRRQEQEVYQSLFQHLEQLGNPEEDPHFYAQIYQNYGISLFAADASRYEEAIKYIEKSIELERKAQKQTDQEDLRAELLNLYVRGGCACAKYGQRTTAEDLFARGKRLYGEDWDRVSDVRFLRRKGQLLYWTSILQGNRREEGFKNLDLAESVFLQVLETEPTAPDAEMLAHIYHTRAVWCWNKRKEQTFSAEEKEAIEEDLLAAMRYAKQYHTAMQTIESLYFCCKLIDTAFALCKSMENEVLAICFVEYKRSLTVALEENANQPDALRILRDVEMDLGIAAMDWGDPVADAERAKEHFEKACDWAHKLADPTASALVDLGGIYHRLGVLAYTQKDYATGDEYCKRSKEQYQTVISSKNKGKKTKALFEEDALESAIDLLWDVHMQQADSWIKRFEEDPKKQDYLRNAKACIDEGVSWVHRLPEKRRSANQYEEMLRCYTNLMDLYQRKSTDARGRYQCAMKALECCDAYLKKADDRETRLSKVEILKSMTAFAVELEGREKARLPMTAKACQCKAEEALKEMLKGGREPELLLFGGEILFAKAMISKDPQKKWAYLQEAQAFVQEVQEHEPMPAAEELLRYIIKAQIQLK